MFHVPFTPYPATDAFAAPVTEVAVVTPHSDAKDDLAEALAGATKALAESGGRGVAFGKIVEEKEGGAFVAVSGWESVEVRASVLSDTVPIAEDLLLDIRVCLPLN